MKVAVVVVAYRNPDDVLACLEALESSTHQEFEVVVCENGGEEAWRDLVGACPAALRGGQGVTFLMEPANLGYAGGVNRGMAFASDADAWWILNPDTKPSPGAMGRYIERLSVGDCDAVGSTVHLPIGIVQSYGGVWRPWFARAVSLGHGAASSADVDSRSIELKQNFLNGASMMVNRRFLDVAGPMREDYFLYCEEVEWCLRAEQHGLKLGYVAEAGVLHEGGSTTGSYDDIKLRPKMPIYLNERNKILLTRDLYPARTPIAAIAALGIAILKYGRARAWKQLAYAVEGWYHGIKDQRGKPSWLY